MILSCACRESGSATSGAHVMVLPGFTPGIHVFTVFQSEENVDGRDKSGHDETRAECRASFVTSEPGS